MNQFSTGQYKYINKIISVQENNAGVSSSFYPAKEAKIK
jgi:hypothetical protein